MQCLELRKKVRLRWFSNFWRGFLSVSFIIKWCISEIISPMGSTIPYVSRISAIQTKYLIRRIVFQRKWCHSKVLQKENRGIQLLHNKDFTQL